MLRPQYVNALLPSTAFPTERSGRRRERERPTDGRASQRHTNILLCAAELKPHTVRDAYREIGLGARYTSTSGLREDSRCPFQTKHNRIKTKEGKYNSSRFQFIPGERESDSRLSGQRGTRGIHGGQLHVLGVRSIIGPPRCRGEGTSQTERIFIKTQLLPLSLSLSLRRERSATVFPDKLSLSSRSNQYVWRLTVC